MTVQRECRKPWLNTYCGYTLQIALNAPEIRGENKKFHEEEVEALKF